MDEIHLRFAAELTFLEWRRQFTRAIEESPLVPHGGSYIDVEEALHVPMPEDLSFSFSADTRFRDARRQIIDRFWPLSQAYQRSVFKSLRSRPPYNRILLETPTVGYIESETLSLKELGFASGDIVVATARRWPLAMALGRLHPRVFPVNLEEFFTSVLQDHQKATYPMSEWDGEYNPAPVGALLLYTEEDAELAQYVRTYYPALHLMSGLELALYFLEYVPPMNERRLVRSYWTQQLPDSWHDVWAALGLMRSKPYPAEYIYGIANGIQVEAAWLPCLVLFHHWKRIKEERLLVPVSHPLPQFFRTLCTDVARTVGVFRQTPEVPQATEKQTPGQETPPRPWWRRLVRRGDSRRRRVPIGCAVPPGFGFAQFLERLPARWRSAERAYALRASRVERAPSAAPTVFLCHSSVDKLFVEQLATDLRALGTGVWMDKWEIRVGDSILDRIEQGLRISDYLAVVLSPEAVASPWVRRELNAATFQELEEMRVTVLPILHRACAMPLLLKDKHYADFTGSYEDGLQTLVARLFPDAVDTLRVRVKPRGAQES